MFRSPPLSPGSRQPLNRNSFRQLSRLLAYARPYMGGLVVAGIASLISTAFNLLFPQLVGRLIDVSFLEANLDQLNRILPILLGVFAGQAIFSGIQNYLIARTGESVVAELRKSLFRHLLGLSSSFFENNRTGDITSRLTSDISTVQSVVSTTLVQVFTLPIVLLGTLAILFFTNWKLTLLILSVVPPVALIARFLGRQIRQMSKAFQDQVAHANAHAEETISGVRVVQSFTAENVETTRYGELIQASLKVALQRARMSAFLGPMIFFSIFAALALVLWYGGRLVALKEISPGELLTFVLYTFNIAGTVGTLTSIFAQVQSALGASSRIFELLDTHTDLKESERPVSLSRAEGRVKFEQVQFGYGDRGHVLENINLQADPGEVVAIVGPSGSGKSTLVSLIPRFYDVTAGRITLDGVDLRDLSLEELRAHIAIVPQETLLFSGTIADNILYGRPGATEKEVREAAQAANAHEFIGRFPEGFQTVVGERGVKLSGGQRQRIAIARALLKNPRLLILDEATSSLDSESESLVQEALNTLMQGRTTFVIAHRLSTIRSADRIVVLDQGRIVEEGRHEALLAKGGLYRDLYELQFRNNGQE
ncbi:ABC transporter ATP-binding protein [Deinococcus cellulosilyticus]|uniref:ABC transporter ATP-binding protein n=1 Tax=Deinococcus cellulosilyticus (strain DSM 18568 / NBRC 106333 / KACC 11606 / 5516J-15) TaxID=1223518 RepID=A0A511MVQ7_DEIC1|nr:ABC transporter transmembrane domain-containing protein [Deinococcus cellulosilyticus]GEM44665.1 ABC transporter ATP-binding protein [Deinococcus cellulosilyticus NBRC 106333 = KACC 11606]